MISNRCARKSLVTNCNSIISKNYLRFLVDSNEANKLKTNCTQYNLISITKEPQKCYYHMIGYKYWDTLKRNLDIFKGQLVSKVVLSRMDLTNYGAIRYLL